MIGAILSFWFSPINIIIGILLIEYSLYKVKEPWNIKEERDSKYPAFRRYDAVHWKRWRLYLASPFVLTRVVLSLQVPISMYIFIKIVLCGHKKPDNASPVKQLLIKKAS